MTGYGQSSIDTSQQRFEVTIRGVNHRYLDVVMRLPEVCRADEAGLQRLIAKRLERGRIELTVEASPIDGTIPQVEVRAEVAAALVKGISRITDFGVGPLEVKAGDLLRAPGVVELKTGSSAWNDEEQERMLEAVNAALDQFVAAREQEGARLADILIEKLDGLDSIAADLTGLRPEVQRQLSETFHERIAQLVEGAGIDPVRLAQETALLVDKSNVAEELERLGAHLAHLREILVEDGAIGKRLDFLVQEVFRELNTMSAKCRSTEMTRACVDAKVLCEELREQLRNVE